jgi:lambda repressor-like predicted transcriptional regulator
MASTLAHELNQPLMALSTFAAARALAGRPAECWPARWTTSSSKRGAPAKSCAARGLINPQRAL